MADIDEAELADYDDEIEEEEVKAPVPAGKKGGSTYVGGAAAGFKDMLLRPELLQAIEDNGFEHPSDVQQEGIPQAIQGSDIICQGKSGMGKTCVFVLTVLQRLDKEPTPDVQCLVLVNSRELALQVSKEFQRFAKNFPAVRVASMFGGTKGGEYKEALSSDETRPHIIVGTPGKILGLLRDGAMDLSKLKFFVLDECDKMVGEADMREQVNKIFVQTKKSKQVMMFSATMAEGVTETCKKYMKKNAIVVQVDTEQLTLHGLTQYYLKLDADGKDDAIERLMDTIEFNQVVIFCKTFKVCDAVGKRLREQNFPVGVIHGKMRQEKRLQTFEDFKGFKHRILVATDLASRGLDIERVNVVINYDIPEDNSGSKEDIASKTDEERLTNGADTYMHRVGRAGRFGTKGLAITFVTGDDDSWDSKTLAAIQERFRVEIGACPDEISKEDYMDNAED